MIEIIIWSKGGQGGVTAMKFILESAIKQWTNSQGFPEFGAERRGAPVQVSIRAAKHDENPPSCQIEEPDSVVLFDASLLENPKSKESILNLKTDGLLFINTSKEPSNFKQVFEGRIAVVDATRIASEMGIGDPTTPFVNTAMAGAIVKIFGFDFELLRKSIEKEIGKQAKINVKAAKLGYEEVVQ